MESSTKDSEDGNSLGLGDDLRRDLLDDLLLLLVPARVLNVLSRLYPAIEREDSQDSCSLVQFLFSPRRPR